MISEPIASLTYYGGKSTRSAKGSGRWIRSLLPDDLDVTYVEPFGGMLGVLLGRKRAAQEIVNDINGRIVNWWYVVRDHADEFASILHMTPYSERQYLDARETIDQGTSIERALKFHIVTCGNIMHTDNGSASFAIQYLPKRSGPADKLAGHPEDIRRVSDRLRGVQLLHRPAIKLLRRLESLDHAVIYCDPPYHTSDLDAYTESQIDHADTLDSLSKQRGRVAIGGYRDEWDELLDDGWRRHEFNTSFQINGTSGTRTEVLWTNYEPVKQGGLL